MFEIGVLMMAGYAGLWALGWAITLWPITWPFLLLLGIGFWTFVLLLLAAMLSYDARPR